MSLDAFGIDELLAERAASGGPYLEFLRRRSMSLGLYVLGPDDVDRQSPHTEDEAYVVLAGTGAFSAGTETRGIRPGDALFVAAGVPHRFHDITEELHLLVVFAPPEGSLG
jgi:mannose-6-phosphate isomerase-like protein (cupin superfamily)